MTAPQTGIETNGEFTTLADEITFLDALAESPRCTLETVGVTPSTDRPLRLLRIGDPVPRTPTPSKSVLIVGGQHGNEPVGRETALTFARDAVFGSEWSAWLGEFDLLVFPTASPDAFAAPSRFTRGLDLNRQHFLLDLIEARVIANVLRDYKPAILVDLHELFGSTTRDRVELLAATNPMVDTLVSETSAAMLDAVRAHLSAENIDNALFPGGNVPETIRNMATLRNGLALLVETLNSEIRTPAERVAWQLETLRGLFEWHTANAAAVAETVSGAAFRVSRRTGPFDLVNGTVLDPVPTGYVLTAEQQDAAAVQIDAFNVSVDDGTVWMRQGSQPVIPYLMDPSASTETRATSATATFEPPPFDRFVRRGGQRVELTTSVVRDGSLFTAT